VPGKIYRAREGGGWAGVGGERGFASKNQKAIMCGL